MRVFLLHRDRDVEIRPELRDPIFDALASGNLFAVANAKRRLARTQGADRAVALPARDAALAQDLELETLWQAMAAGDDVLYETAKRVVLSSLVDAGEISYRQQVLADCLAQPAVVREIYGLAIEALGNERSAGALWHEGVGDMSLYRSATRLKLDVDVLRRLRRLAEEQASSFRSDGFVRFFAMLRDELSDDYLDTVERYLVELDFTRGLLESAELTTGNKGANYLVRRPRSQRWSDRVSWRSREPSFSFTIGPGDEHGFKALEEIRGAGLDLVAKAVGEAALHVKGFFSLLRLELAFYLGCLNLRDRLDEKGEPTCIPIPLAAGERALSAEGLYDVCLALHTDGRVVGNDLRADGKAAAMITGANQGGKSTFLRSVGVAQLMLQCGMFVGASSLRAAVCTGLFSHFKREEDASMERGKLEEELLRMSEIADEIAPDCVLLCNESFASTNEREGSAIARHIVRAMVEKRIRVFFVTHMFELAHGFSEEQLDEFVFLRAERGPGGERTFRLVEGEPLPTSYGEDAFHRVFGEPLPIESAAVSDAGP